jgi:hypothetical protein
MFILRYEQGLRQGENRATLWGAGKSEGVLSFGDGLPLAFTKARERRLEETLIKVFAADPRRVNPKGVSSGRRSKTSSGRQGFPEGSKPGNRGLLGRPSASAVGIPLG